MEGGDRGLAEENCRLREELSRCKDDKEFVWMLWKDLQKQNPDLTSTVDMIITREELKSEQRMRELAAAVQSKQEEATALSHVLEEREREVIQKDAKLEKMKAEVTVLEHKLKSHELEREKQANEERVNLLKMKRKCTELEEKLEEERRSLFVHHEEMKIIASNCEEHAQQNEQLKLESDSKDLQIQQLQQEKVYLNKTVEHLSEQNEEQKQNLQRQLEELQSAKRELLELRNSRDAWASHTTLQSTAVQQLQRENSDLKLELSRLREKAETMGREREGWCDQERGGAKKRVVVESQVALERVEKELFETQLLLEAKSKELEGVRGCHERRLRRLQALQTSQALLEEQLLTYTSNPNSPSNAPCKRAMQRKGAPAKALRHEDSSAVWNELALCRERCQQLETDLLGLEEERDSLRAECLRSQSSAAELRTQLEQGRNDLERKLSAIAKTEVDSVSELAQSRQLKHKVRELGSAVSKLKQQKAKLQSQQSCAERELSRLREETVQMQTEIVSLTRRKTLKQLQALSKATMTDEATSCHYESSISVTDSATQVDLSPLRRPNTRSTAVSPIKPPPVQTREASTQTSPAVERKLTDRPSRVHRRTHSEGDPLSYRRRARDALGKVKKISRELRDMSLDGAGQGTKGTNPSGEEESSPEIRTQSIGCQCEASMFSADQTVNSGRGLSGLQKCALEQQIKTLQKKLRTLTKQLSSGGSVRQALSQSLETERREGGRARAEVKELTIRLQGMKTVVQCLQGEVHRLQESNRQLERKLSCLSETKRGRSESDWKRLESEKRVLFERCSALSESVKSLEEKVQQKSYEHTEAQEKLARLERDLRQKRQLLDSQRDKMKTLTQQATEDQAKLQNMERDMNRLREFLDQHRHKVESLQTQLSRQTEEKAEALRLLTSCQQELSHTVGQLSLSQRESEERQKQLDQERESHEQQLKELQEKHRERLESAQQKLREREKLARDELRDELRRRELFLREHRQFVKELAARAEEHAKRKRPGPRDGDTTASSSVEISSRVREIARSTLHLSDLEIDDLFSDDYGQQQEEEPIRLVGSLEDDITKLPFANSLVQRFMEAFS